MPSDSDKPLCSCQADRKKVQGAKCRNRLLAGDITPSIETDTITIIIAILSAMASIEIGALDLEAIDEEDLAAVLFAAACCL